MNDPYPIFTLPRNARDSTEPMGTKEKFWFQHVDGHRWLFKFNRPRHGDDWSEKVACETAESLGLPHAYVELAIFEGRLGVMVRDFTNLGKLTLVHGNELLVKLINPTYPKDQNYRVTEHTVERVLSILDQPWMTRPDGFVSHDEEIITAADVFAGYLMLDALIGNTDRHHENWAVVVPTHDPGGAVDRREVRLAPTFDHASCLGFNLSDKVRIDFMTPGNNRSIETFADKALSKLYLSVDAAKPLSPIAAFAESTKDRFLVRRAWLMRLSSVADDSFRQIIGRIPDHRTSQAARDFAYGLLLLNKARLLQLENA
jgi:hypothetical protein